jgi:hypothetical protein
MLRRVRVLLGTGGVFSAVRDHGLTEAESGIAKLLNLGFIQLGVALLHEVQRFIHPAELIFLVGLDDTALLNCTEQLIASPVQGRLWTTFGPSTDPSLSGQSLLRVEG